MKWGKGLLIYIIFGDRRPWRRQRRQLPVPSRRLGGSYEATA